MHKLLQNGMYGTGVTALSHHVRSDYLHNHPWQVKVNRDNQSFICNDDWQAGPVKILWINICQNAVRASMNNKYAQLDWCWQLKHQLSITSASDFISANQIVTEYVFTEPKTKAWPQNRDTNKPEDANDAAQILFIVCFVVDLLLLVKLCKIFIL